MHSRALAGAPPPAEGEAATAELATLCGVLSLDAVKGGDV